MKVLDTTFLIDVLGGVKETSSILDGEEILLTTQINMYEFTRSLFLRNISSSRFLRIMELFENVRVLPLDDAAIVKSAEISAKLIKGGERVPDNDCLISGIALSKGVSTVVTRNVKHFERMKGIHVETY